MISRIDHIAIAVRDHEQALLFFRDILGALPGESMKVNDGKFFWQTLVLGDLSRLEILSPSGSGGFLDGFLEKRPGGFHHITMQTPDLEAMIAHLDAHGIPYFGKNQYPGGIWKEIFIHPKDAFGTLIQIAEFDAQYWMVPEANMPENVRWQIEKRDNNYALTCAHPGGGKVRFECSREDIQDLAQMLQDALQ